jgi:hypothetical protein
MIRTACRSKNMTPWLDLIDLKYPDLPLLRLLELRGMDADDPDDWEFVEERHEEDLQRARKELDLPHPNPLQRYYL